MAAGSGGAAGSVRGPLAPGLRAGAPRVIVRPMSGPLRIAFGGTMQVGKTTCADHLVRRHGFVKHALADPIKRIARESFGWDGAKDARGRRLLQELGTVGRHYDPDVWLDRLDAKIRSEGSSDVVVDDLRLAREVAYLERAGFVCVLVTRPSELVRSAVAPVGVRHETETGLDAIEFDRVIDNAGTFEDLYAHLDRLVTTLREEEDTERPRREAGPSA